MPRLFLDSTGDPRTLIPAAESSLGRRVDGWIAAVGGEYACPAAAIQWVHNGGRAIAAFWEDLTPEEAAGPYAQGVLCAHAAVAAAQAVALPACVRLFVGIEAGWTPSAEFLAGWADGQTAGPFAGSGGVYGAPYAVALQNALAAARAANGNAAKMPLWSAQPEPGCAPAIPEWGPATCAGATVEMWQWQENWPTPAGPVDLNLVADGFADAWEGLQAGEFNDVPAGAWYAADVAAAAKAGLMDGTAPGVFAPDATVTRAQLATVAVRLAGMKPVANAGEYAATVSRELMEQMRRMGTVTVGGAPPTFSGSISSPEMHPGPSVGDQQTWEFGPKRHGPYGARRSRPRPGLSDHHAWTATADAIPPSYANPLVAAMPVEDQQQSEMCFPAGTRTQMADGTQKPIEDIRAGESVISHTGASRMVTAVFARRYSGPMRRISTYGTPDLVCTPNHPILSEAGEWVAAADVLMGDYLVQPILSGAISSTAESIEVMPLLAESFEDAWRFRESDGFVRTYPIGPRSHPIPASIGVSKQLGRLVGLFLAEGSARYRRNFLVYSFSSQGKDDAVIAEVAEGIRDIFGVDARVQPRPNNVTNVVVHSTAIAHFFMSLCGYGCARKSLHPCVFGWSPEARDAVVSGWLDGDGWFGKRRTSGVTVSSALAYDMTRLLLMSGRRPTLRYGGSNPKKRPRWDVSLYEGASWRRKERGDALLIRVREVEEEPFAGLVYNLEVEEDHSYIANTIAVHNCVAFASTEIRRWWLRKLGQPDAMLSAPYVYARAHELAQETTEGLEPQQAGEALRTYGAVPWAQDPLNPTSETVSESEAASPASLDAAAAPYRIATYGPVDVGDVAAMQQAIMHAPVLIAIPVPESGGIEDPIADGQGGWNVLYPPGNAQVIGGHAIMLYGWKTDASGNLWWLLRNSWGAGWADNGSAWLDSAHPIWECWSLTCAAVNPACLALAQQVASLQQFLSAYPNIPQAHKDALSAAIASAQTQQAALGCA